MTAIQLFLEFFRAGLFAVGGGLATIPFLMDIGARTGWFTSAELADMIAVSESTPGPMGVNMATYVGFTILSVGGCVIATLGLITPSIIIILIIAQFLKKFRENRLVQDVFYGLRPASTAMIAAAGLEVIQLALLRTGLWGQGAPMELFRWKCILLAAALLVCTRVWTKLHPVVWIAAAAVAGVVFQL